MEIALAAATMLGGGSAVWFFWDKIVAWWRPERTPTGVLARSVQDELHARADFELSRRLLHACRDTSDGFVVVRSVFILAGEIPEPAPGERPDARKQRELLHHGRFQRLYEAMRDLLAAGREASVLWGPTVEEKIGAVQQALIELECAAREELLYIGAPIAAPVDRQEQLREVLYAQKASEDAFAQKVRSALGAIEAEARGHLRPGSATVA